MPNDSIVVNQPQPIAYRIDDAARILNLSRACFIKLVDSGKIPYSQPLGFKHAKLFSVKDLDSFLESNRTISTPSKAATS